MRLERDAKLIAALARHIPGIIAAVCEWADLPSENFLPKLARGYRPQDWQTATAIQAYEEQPATTETAAR